MVVFTLYTGVLLSVTILASLIMKIVFYRRFSGNLYKYLLIPKHYNRSVILHKISNILVLGLYIYFSKDIENVFFVIGLGVATIIGIFILNNISHFLANLKRDS